MKKIKILFNKNTKILVTPLRIGWEIFLFFIDYKVAAVSKKL